MLGVAILRSGGEGAVTARRGPSVLRILGTAHRWVGVAMCVLFALWFASGSVLLFVPFPSLSQGERLSHLQAIRMAAIRIAPQAAIAASNMPHATSLKIIEGPGAPFYVIGDADGRIVAVDAGTGEPVVDVGRPGAEAMARRFTGRPVRDVAGPLRYDQWIVHQQFDPLRPFYRVALEGQDGLEVYVSARTGDIVQQTRGRQRAWNMVGAVVHWIYPTLIRRSFALWDDLVWCVSLVGVGLALSGITLGLARMRRSLRRVRNPSISPYKGLFRWHHVTGLGAGIFLLSWIFSGWLSMDHGRLFSTGTPSRAQRSAYAGLTLDAAAAQVTVADLRRLGPVVEASLDRVGGRAFLVGRAGDASMPEIVDLSGPDKPLLRSLPTGVVETAVGAAWPGVRIVSTAPVADDDAYEHIVTEPQVGRLTRVMLADGPSTWVEIDAATGQVKSLLDRSRRLYRWIYYGMHTFDLPGLSSHDTVRKVLILCLLAAGEALSLTGIVLGARRIRRMLPRGPRLPVTIAEPSAPAIH